MPGIRAQLPVFRQTDMFRADLLKGKKILVTGGGTGLGKSIARRYLQLGAELLICGRRTEVLDAAAGELAAETGGRIETLQCDVRSADQVESMMSRIWERGPLDVLVNNAAANFIARTEKLSPRAIDAAPASRMNEGVTSSGSPNQNASTSGSLMPSLATARMSDALSARTAGRADVS